MKNFKAKKSREDLKPKSLEQLENYIGEKKKTLIQDIRRSDMAAPIIDDPKLIATELLAIVKHFIKPGPIRLVLGLRVKGAKYSELVNFLRINMNEIKKLEKVGLDVIYKGIEKEGAFRVLGPNGRIVSGIPGGVKR